MILTVKQTRIRLRPYGRSIMTRYKYEQAIKLGLLEKPIQHKGMSPFHTTEQIERYKARLTPQIDEGSPLWKQRLAKA